MGCWSWSSVFQTTYPSQKKTCSQNLWSEKEKKLNLKIFHQKKIQKVLIKVDEIAEVFLNLSNFVQDTIFTLAPPSRCTLNLKQLTKVTKVSWSFQLSCNLYLKENSETTNFISPKKNTSKKPWFFRVNQWVGPGKKSKLINIGPTSVPESRVVGIGLRTSANTDLSVRQRGNHGKPRYPSHSWNKQD